MHTLRAYASGGAGGAGAAAAAAARPQTTKHERTCRCVTQDSTPFAEKAPGEPNPRACAVGAARPAWKARIQAAESMHCAASVAPASTLGACRVVLQALRAAERIPELHTEVGLGKDEHPVTLASWKPSSRAKPSAPTTRTPCLFDQLLHLILLIRWSIAVRVHCWTEATAHHLRDLGQAAVACLYPSCPKSQI